VALAILKIQRERTEMQNFKKMWSKRARYAPAAEGIFVQMSLTGTEIIGTRHADSGFWYALPPCRGVGVCGGRVARKSKFFDIFTLTPTPYRFRRSKCLTLRSRPRGTCVNSLPEIGCGGLGEVASKLNKKKTLRKYEVEQIP